MLKYAKIANNINNSVFVLSGENIDFAISQGFVLMEVEQAYNGNWYVAGFCPVAPEPTYQEKRLAEYPPLNEQLDMQYWDKINGTNLWADNIALIKAKYPKI